MSEYLAYGLLALLAVAIAAVIWASWRYQAYLNQLRSGKGKRPARVWKPFWFN